jgi:type VI secretion system secreted protein Hcp
MEKKTLVISNNGVAVLRCEWIEAIQFNNGVSQMVSTTASSAGGASAERADVRPFTFLKQVDSSSPKLFQACAAGTHFDKITIAIYRAGGDEKVKSFI